MKFERLLLTSLQTSPRFPSRLPRGHGHLLADKLWIRDLIRKRLGIPATRILFSEHHLSHAASAFYCSPFEKAAILTIDGVGEWATASVMFLAPGGML